jgi:hypothetical protein
MVLVERERRARDRRLEIVARSMDIVEARRIIAEQDVRRRLVLALEDL